MKRLAADRFAFFALVLTLLLPAGFTAAQEHQLTLDRERAVGAKFQIQVKANQKQTQSQTVNGQAVGSETHAFSGTMTAVAEVLSVHENKQVRSISLDIQKFEGESDGQPVIIDVTKKIVATADKGETTFKYEGGGEIAENAVEILDVLATFMLEDEPQGASEDEMFKLNQPRKTGSKWECNNELIAKDMNKGGELVIEPDGIESEFRFVDVAEFAGKQAAVFEVTIEMNKFSIPGAQAQGLKIAKSEGKLQMSGLVPLDPKSADGAMQMQMQVDITAEIAVDNQKVSVSFAVSGAADAEFREIK